MPKITLRAARVNMGLSQKEVACILKISNKTLHSWENGDTSPSAKHIDALCDLYKMSYNDINFLPSNSPTGNCNLITEPN